MSNRRLFQIVSIDRHPDSVTLLIQGYPTPYLYHASPFIIDRFQRIAAYSQGRALEYLKRNTPRRPADGDAVIDYAQPTNKGGMTP